MYPELFSLGPITVYSYGVLLAASYLLGLRLAMTRARRWGLDASRVLDLGIYMPAMVWGTQYRYSPDAILLVFASHPYDPEDYVRTYDEFCALVRNRQQ